MTIDKSGASWLVIIDWSSIAENQSMSIGWLPSRLTSIGIDWNRWSIIYDRLQTQDQLNPFTLKSDQVQISPAASPEI